MYIFFSFTKCLNKILFTIGKICLEVVFFFKFTCYIAFCAFLTAAKYILFSLYVSCAFFLSKIHFHSKYELIITILTLIKSCKVYLQYAVAN